ncbi:hypothetical protein [Streptomyces xylophagus]|uniref:hypothetical protein n=1 Tax=Streptomyces xylophagus TaxID=285514 RepID=UPI0005B8FF4E|nr:hypothetical protein [Streptomyces xylophagus]
MAISVVLVAGLTGTLWAFALGAPLEDISLAIGVLTSFAVWHARPLKRVEANDAELAAVHARTLARIVAEEEGLVRRQLLGKDVRPINIHFLLQRAPSRGAAAPPAGRVHVHTRTAAAALASSRAMLAEMLAEMDHGDNRIRATAALLDEMAEQWNNHPRFRPAWRSRRLNAVSAQPKPTARRAGTS